MDKNSIGTPDDDEILLDCKSNLDVTLLLRTCRDDILECVWVDMLVQTKRGLATDLCSDVNDSLNNSQRWRAV